MALKSAKETDGHTLWFHMENGKTVVRRIHTMQVQDRLGTIHSITKDNLPDVVHTSAGERFKGAHLAQILLKPEKIKKAQPFTATVPNPFPSLRDLGNMAFGVLGFLLLRFFVNLGSM